ncbi:MAG: hypothetical protein KA715_08660 [Xanthomonadaceae bacterium]|nr:hypothetical protein [Xanthomonadaceae bacterium]
MTKCAVLLILLVSTFAQAKEIVGFQCRIDERPVDGMLQELTLKKNSDQTYSVKLKQAYYNREKGKAVETIYNIFSQANCEYDIKSFLGNCFQSSSKEDQTYLVFTGEIIRYYDSSKQKTVELPEQLKFAYMNFNDEQSLTEKLKNLSFDLNENCSSIEE